MIIQSWVAQYENGQVKHIVLVFGIGLIGRAVQNAINTRFCPSTEKFPFIWTYNSKQKIQSTDIRNRIVELGLNSTCPVQVDIVWAAGKGGFSADTQDFAEESLAYEQSLNIVDGILFDLPFSVLRFHLLSSAGGLFEGQQLVDAKSVASINRPYGHAKKRLESDLAMLPEAVEKLIYRPSSVYGYGGRGTRIGLVAAAVRSAVNNSTVRVYAKPDTLRDYVYVDDIGHFIACNIEKRTFDQTMFILASGKPTSTVELVDIIERTTEKRLSIQYELGKDNATSNTYRSTCLPDDWVATPIGTGVYLTAMKIKNEFLQ